jgi:hypothetical protein
MNYLRWLVRRRTNTDLAREVGAHIAERVDDLLEQGLSAADARAQARREFGNATLHIEQSREVWIAPWVSSVSQDVRYAVRSLTRQPGFTLSAVGILGIGIAFITAFFSVLNATLARPWRVPDPSTLAVVKPRPAPGQQYGVLSVPEYLYLRGHNQSFVSLATHTGGGGPVVHADVVVDVQSRFVSANYFDTLGITMMLGRGFLPEEEDYRSPRAVAVISERLWRDVFGAPTSILGSTIRVRDRPFTVIGVAPPGFFDIEEFPREVWMPLPALAIHFGDSWLHGFTDPRATSSSVFGRLRPGVSRESAQAELDVLSRQFRSTVPMAWGGFSLHSTRPIDVDRERHMRQLPRQRRQSAAGSRAVAATRDCDSAVPRRQPPPRRSTAGDRVAGDFARLGNRRGRLGSRGTTNSRPRDGSLDGVVEPTHAGRPGARVRNNDGSGGVRRVRRTAGTPLDPRGQ